MFAMDVDTAKTIAAEIHAACPCFPPDRANIRRVVRAHHIIDRHTSGKAEIIRYRQSWQMVYLIPSQVLPRSGQNASIPSVSLHAIVIHLAIQPALAPIGTEPIETLPTTIL